MEGLVELILGKYDGSLKAEHGTGINMAPYVEREWGEKATALMWRVKELADPDGILGPGVVLNRDPGAHLRNLKTTPEIEEVANHCVECGFCEPACPSRDLTTTPRQRIVLRREMARQPAGSPVLDRAARRSSSTTASRPAPPTAPACSPARSGSTPASWSRSCGPSSTAERAETVARRVGRSAGSAVERAARGGLRAGDAVQRAVGERGPVRGASSAARGGARPRARARVAGEHAPPGAGRSCRATAARGRGGRLPARLHQPDLRRAAPGQRTAGAEPARGARRALSERAGKPVWIPEDVAGNCCATPWHSKGYREGHELMAKRDARVALALDAAAASCRSSATPAPARSASWPRSKGSLERGQPSATPSSRSSTRRAGPPSACCRRSRSRASSPRRVLHPTCSSRHLGTRRGARRRCGGRDRRRRRRCRFARPAAASPATAASCIRS